MLTTSSAYKTAIAASSRQIKSRCAIAYTYPFIHSIISSVSTTTEHADSDKNKVYEGLGLGNYYNAGKYRGFKNNLACNSSGVYGTSEFEIAVIFNANQTISHTEVVGDLQGEITVNNLAVNGGFEDGLTGWTYGYTTPVVTGGIAKFTATARFGKMVRNEIFVVGHKYAFVARVKANSTDVLLGNDWGSTAHSGSGNFEILSFVATADATSMHAEVIDFRSSGWAEIEVDYIMVIDITDDIGTDYFLNLKYKAMDYFSMPQVIQKYETAVDYQILVKNSAGTVLKTITVTNNYLLKNIHDYTAVSSVNRINLLITKYSRASTSAKIASFTPRTVVNYNGNQIMTIEVNEEIETEQGTVFGTAIAKQCSIVFNNIEGDFNSIDKLAQRAFYPEIGATLADGTIEYEPMGTYYTDEWRFDDDKLTLNVSGLDVIGVLGGKPFDHIGIDAYMLMLAGYIIDYLNFIVDYAAVGYSVENKVDNVLLENKQNWGYDESISRLSTREILTQLMQVAFYWDGPRITPDPVGIGYLISNKHNNKIIAYYKITENRTGYYSSKKDIVADNYFKIRTARNDAMLVNSVRIIALTNQGTEATIPDRIANDGEYQYTLRDNVFLPNATPTGHITDLFPFMYRAQQTETRIEWQGDPSIELGDDMSITDITATKKYKGYCIGNQYKFDGGLRVITRMKTLETEAL